jgi:hypothetical protein
MKWPNQGMDAKGWSFLISCALLGLAFLAPIQWPAKARISGYVFIIALAGVGMLIGERLAEGTNKARGLHDPDDE